MNNYLKPSMPYASDRANKKFHNFMLAGINAFLGTDFTEDDMDVIYTYLGNRVCHERTVRFVKSGYDLREIEERTDD